MAKGKKQAGSSKKAGSPKRKGNRKPKAPVVSLGQRTRSAVRGGRGHR